MNKNKIKIGIPKNTLQNYIENLFNDAGYAFEIKGRPSSIYVDDKEIECFLSGGYEIPQLIRDGVLDAGVVSKGILLEAGKENIEEICKIGTPSSDWKTTRVALAVPENSKIKKVEDLEGKKIITRLPGIAKEFLKNKGLSSVKIEVSQGTNEQKVPELADAVIEFTSSGDTFKFYNLRILEIISEEANLISLVVSKELLKDKWKKEKIEDIGLLLVGARLAQDYAGLMLHASNDMMEDVLNILPSLKKPTVTHLRGENWFDVFTVAEKNKIREIIPSLKKIGCTDIIEFPLKKLVI